MVFYCFFYENFFPFFLISLGNLIILIVMLITILYVYRNDNKNNIRMNFQLMFLSFCQQKINYLFLLFDYYRSFHNLYFFFNLNSFIYLFFQNNNNNNNNNDNNNNNNNILIVFLASYFVHAFSFFSSV